MKILKPLYVDMRQYLINLLEITDTNRVIKAYNNNQPIPQNAIIMAFRSSAHLDQFSNKMEGDKLVVFNSVKGTMQLDFYGEDSYDLAQQVATCWNTPITTEILKECVPLNQPQVKDLTFVNEAGQYELRFMLDLDLQYNTKYEKTVNIVTDVSQFELESINAI